MFLELPGHPESWGDVEADGGSRLGIEYEQILHETEDVLKTAGSLHQATPIGYAENCSMLGRLNIKVLWPP